MGLVRETDLRVTLAIGNNFVSTGLTKSTSPELLSMTVARGFVANSRLNQADRLRVWNNMPGASAPYKAYYLQRGGANPEKWVQEGDQNLTNLNGDPTLVPAFEGIFIIHQTSPLLWDQEPPELP